MILREACRKVTVLKRFDLLFCVGYSPWLVKKLSPKWTQLHKASYGIFEARRRERTASRDHGSASVRSARVGSSKMSLGRICEFTLNKGFQQGIDVRNREKQKTEADRDRASKKACDEQPAGDQLYKRNPQAQ